MTLTIKKFFQHYFITYLSCWNAALITTINIIFDCATIHMQLLVDLVKFTYKALVQQKAFYITTSMSQLKLEPRAFAAPRRDVLPTNLLSVGAVGMRESLLSSSSIGMTSSFYATYYAHTSSERRPCNVFVYIVAIKYPEQG